MNKRLTFTTYPSLKNAFKEMCDMNDKTMSLQLTEITSAFLNKTLAINQLENAMSEYKENQKEKEAKSYKLAILIDENLYLKLKQQLELIKIRPASFFSYAMCYSLNNVSVKEIYARKAMKVLKESSPAIKHIVYGLKYYKPLTGKEDGLILIGTEYFIDKCSDQRFRDYYEYPSPFLEVLAVHSKANSD